MNNSLPRLIEGIIATLRSDVIPHVPDAFARGQAVGVIDLLNNLAPRLDWAPGPLEAGLRARREALAMAWQALGVPQAGPGTAAAVPAAVLLAERDRLDAEIGDLVAQLMAAPGPGAAEEAALGHLRRHMHADLKAELGLTRRPLFAEIASGAGQPDRTE